MSTDVERLLTQPPDDPRDSPRAKLLRRIAACSMGLVLLMLVPVTASIWASRHHLFEVPYLFGTASALLLLSALGAVMAAWTVGGPGSYAIRCITAVGIGTFIVWAALNFAQLVANVNKHDVFMARGGLPTLLTALLIWLMLSYLSAVAFCMVAARCGWQIQDELPARPVEHQFGLSELMLATTSFTLGTMVAVASQSAISVGGGAESFVIRSFLLNGIPVTVVAALALTLGLGTLGTIGSGAAATLGVAVIYALILSSGPDISIYVIAFSAAALMEYTFIILGVELIRAMLEWNCRKTECES